MICHGSRRTILTRLHKHLQASRSPFRMVATSASVSSSSLPPSRSPLDPTPATSSARPGASQPFSTTPSPPSPTNPEPGQSSSPAPTEQPAKIVRSSVIGGTELTGLAYLKNEPKIFAKEDDEYPDWLWTLLDDGKQGAAGVDVASMTRKQRGKYDRKMERLKENIPTPIPLHEQSIDLTQDGDDAIVSLQRRQEVKKSAREARRKQIKENNFLKAL